MTPNQENLTADSAVKTVYHYCDINGQPVHKAKEVFKQERRIILYPYSLNRLTGQVSPKKIKQLEFIGWTDVNKLPDYFRKGLGYGFAKQSAKQLMSIIYAKIRGITKIVVGINVKSKFAKNTITFNWGELDEILKEINKDKYFNDKNRKLLINNLLANKTNQIKRITKNLYSGELETFLKRFDSFEKISNKDLDSLAHFVEELPPNKITTTSHFIKTKERIDIVYLEDIIVEFEKLLSDKKDIEEKWQQFFNKASWIMNHLFPYQVILKKDKAYLGGKTIENEEGRIVDYLYQCGFKDNFALIEIKTHKKDLLKRTPYRKPAVFAISDELSGGVNQCLDQKDVFLRDMGSKERLFDPKCILVIGQKSNLSEEQKSCFELYRANQKNVDIVTFDELLTKLNGFKEVVTGQVKTEKKKR